MDANGHIDDSDYDVEALRPPRRPRPNRASSSLLTLRSNHNGDFDCNPSPDQVVFFFTVFALFVVGCMFVWWEHHDLNPWERYRY